MHKTINIKKTVWLALLGILVRPTYTIQGLFWLALRKRVRGLNILKAAAAINKSYYHYWIKNVESKLAFSSNVGAQNIAIIIDCRQHHSHESMRRTISSIINANILLKNVIIFAMPLGNQHSYGLTILSKWSDIISDLASHNFSYILPLQPGQELSQHTIGTLALYINDDFDVIYWDEDCIDEIGRRAKPWLKGEWNFLHFISQDYISHSCLIKIAMLRMFLDSISDDFEVWKVLSFILLQQHDFISVKHLPYILTHNANFQIPLKSSERCDFINYLSDGRPNCQLSNFGTIVPRWHISSASPSVSIIIPTRNEVEILRNCIASIGITSYDGRIEIIIVDNGSHENETLKYLSSLENEENIRVIKFDGPFNFSYLNNLAVRSSKSDLICLLNNDTEVINEDWLNVLVEHATQPNIGAVGARLVYPDGSLQHGGVVVGIGGAAGHIERGLAMNAEGYFALSYVTRYVTAVTAACLMVARDRYIEVGGLDEKQFPVAFNDVDFCMKLHEAGYKNVYASGALLFHHESVSRGDDSSLVNFPRYSAELAALQARWNTLEYADPFFSKYFVRSSETLILDA